MKNDKIHLNELEIYDPLDLLLFESFKNNNYLEKDCKVFEKFTDPIEFSRRHKLNMNRIFRQKVGGSFLPFPEVDTSTK